MLEARAEAKIPSNMIKIIRSTNDIIKPAIARPQNTDK